MVRRVNRRSFLLAVAAGVTGAALFDKAVNLGGSDPPDHRVWSRIEAWMDGRAPEALEVLRPGVNEESIDRAEEILELELPESFRRSLARHDGQEMRWPSLVEFGFLMPLQQVVDESRSLAESYEQRSGATAADEWWRPGLIPFVSRDGDYLCLALEPPKGRPVARCGLSCTTTSQRARASPPTSVRGSNVGRTSSRPVSSTSTGPRAQGYCHTTAEGDRDSGRDDHDWLATPIWDWGTVRDADRCRIRRRGGAVPPPSWSSSPLTGPVRPR